MSLSVQTLRRIRIGLGIILLSVVLFAPCAAQAEGEDPAVIEKVTNLNKKALDAYNNLDFEDARKLLKQALDLCGSSGLDKHPIKARTHVHMGVVLIAAKQQELGVKQFKKALEIQPDIQVTKALANPEIIQAFEEAGAGGGPGGNEAGEGEPAPGGGATPPSDGGPAPEDAADISHMAISHGKKGKPVAITVTVSPNLTGYTKMVLAYRAEGGEEFLALDMRRSGNRFVGEIPAVATQGNLVSYYIEAESEDETAVASSGSEDKPYSVSLSAGGGGGREEDEDDEGPPFFVALLGGVGIGYATGNGEVNAANKVNAGFAPSSAGQIVVEAGYFISPDFRLSLQVRYQMITGTTPLNLDRLQMASPGMVKNILECGSDHLCYGVNYAVAAMARGSWFFGSGGFRPYFSLALGGGQIRHVVKFTSLSGGVCGVKGGQACVDTVLAGPVFAGPGGGALISLSPNFGFIVEVNSLLGFPTGFTLHFDFNAGVAARF